MSEIAEISLHRVEYLLRQFDLTRQELLSELNKGRKEKLTEADVFSEAILYSTLDELDKVFERGQAFYFGDEVYKPNQRASILFRRRSAATRLSLADKQLISRMERHTTMLNIYRQNGNSRITEQFTKCGLDDEPARVASYVREELGSRPQKDDMSFLAHVIDLLAEKGIMVLEHVETATVGTNDLNLAGFYIKPNYIIIVRDPHSIKHEIFTLLHELGHYLLHHEGIDLVSDRHSQTDGHPPSDEETWCDEFAFAFLLGDAQKLKDLKPHQSELIQELSKNTHLSENAIYSHFLEQQRTGPDDRQLIREMLAHCTSSARDTKSAADSRPVVSKLEKHIYAKAYQCRFLEEFDLLYHFKTKDLGEVLNAM